jgi:hypothetical protein
MQMIDVLKRLAELDSTNPTVEQTMTQEQSLATVTNIEGEIVAECGPMGMNPMSSMDRPSTPATFSINASAESGAEVSSMLRDIMNLAGVTPSMGDLDHDGDHDFDDHKIELDTPRSLEVGPMKSAGDEMGSLIGMVDRMNGDDSDSEKEGLGGALAGGAIGALAGGPLGALTGAAAGDSLTDPDPEEKKEGSVARMADDVRGMADKMADEGIGAGFDAATTTPDEKVEPHKYGNDQVTPKPKEPAKVNGGGNPYTESVEVQSVSAQLLKAYAEFKKQ